MNHAWSYRPPRRSPKPLGERKEIRVTVYMKRREREKLGIIARGVKKSLSRLMVESALSREIRPPIPEANLEQYRSLLWCG